MKILVVNSGSSSLKYQLIDMTDSVVLAKGVCDRIGIPESFIKGEANGKSFKIMADLPDHIVAINLLMDCLTKGENAVLSSINEIGAVGHRVVHSGGIYNESVVITDEVIEKMKETYDLAPLHNPASIKGVIACREAMPDVAMVLVFDTAFHSTMPPYAYMYGIAYEDYEQYKIRKYGFHGTSHMYVSREAAKALNKDIKDLKIVTCHLGNGASIAAVDGGKCVDTTMGFTPLEGLIMGTRCGDMDLAAFSYLCEKKGMTSSQGVQYVNKQCGLLGISGISGDFRDLNANAATNERAQLAIDMFNYRVKKYIGSYAAAMGGLNCIVFTAGIGENTPNVREECLSGLEFLGVKLDPAKNNPPRGEVSYLNTEDSKVKILLIPTNEELVIARETLRLVK